MGTTKSKLSASSTPLVTKEEENVSDTFAMKIDERFSTNAGNPLPVDDFQLIKVLGRGSFGKVNIFQLRRLHFK